jgi:osmotically-inducible protein OsmY
MNRILLGILMLMGTSVIGQQQPLNQEPPVLNARVSPENSTQVDQSNRTLQDKAAGNARIQSNLQSAFDDDPVLSGTDLTANVDDERITLTGTVQSYLQHQRVVQLVSPYSNYREIVDKVTVQ